MKPNQNWKLAEALPPMPDNWLENFPDFVRQILWNRNLRDAQVAEEFLNPKLASLSNPFELEGMEQTTLCLLEAIDRKDSICIFGDYDVDGVTSMSLLFSILEAYGITPSVFVPTRIGDGYGLNETGWNRCLDENGKPDFLIAVDCGTSSNEQIDFIRKNGTRVIVLDHHEPSELGPAITDAIVNPKLESQKRFEYLCSAGVVFKLMHALLKLRPIPGINSSQFLRQFLDLVAVATIADIVPLRDENRIFVRHGLRQLIKSTNPGLKALSELTGITSPRVQTYPGPQPTPMIPSASLVGFRLGPRLNAAGRVDHPRDALNLLLEKNPANAAILAARLNQHNLTRQNIELNVRNEAIELLESNPAWLKLPVIVLASKTWHPGIMGIISSHLMRHYHKPAFAIAIDENGIGKGSGRSIPGISLVKAIEATRYLLTTGGGHDMAAGITIEENCIDAFRKAFSFWISSINEQKSLPVPDVQIDAELHFSELNLNFLKQCELLEPFGNSNPPLVLMSRNVRPTEPPKVLKSHLKFFLSQDSFERDAIMFDCQDSSGLPEPPWDIVYTLDRNIYRGRMSLNIIIQDIRSSQPTT